jgi:hypothetical protein
VSRLLQIASFALVCVAVQSAPTVPLDGDRVIQGIDRAQQAREERLNGYSVTEHYTIRNSRFTAPAELVAAVTYMRDSGKTYRVLSRTGPPFLQSNVLDRILKEETDMSHGEARRSALITSANYRMRLTGQQDLDGRRCDVMELTPRVKNAHLLKGKAWVDAENQTLLRIEGKPVASPSFWARSPEIVRDYSDIGEFSFAQKSVAISSTFLLGRTEMTIEYTGYKINAAK